MPRHLTRFILLLQILTLIALAALPATLLWAVFAPGAWDAMLATLPPGTRLPSGPGARIGLVLTGLLPSAAMAWALISIFRLLARYRGGDVFGASCARYIRRAGQALLLFAGLRIVAHPVQTVLLTLDNPPGAHTLSISVSHADLGLVLGGGLLLVIGWVTGQAAALAEDNAGFV